MASNYEKAPIFLLERTWDDLSKLPEKYKFQGGGSIKPEVYIDSGTFGIEFFLVKTLPQFNEAGRQLDWSWPQTFLEFEKVLGDSYQTSWHEVLSEHFPEPLDGEESTSPREKEDFERAITLFIKKVLNNDKPRDLQYIYMQPGGDYRLSKDLLTPPRLHAQRFKEMLRIAALLPAGNIPEPNDALALEWYYMSYHKSDRERFVLSKTDLKGETLDSVTKFFQNLFEIRKNDGTLERQELERIKKRALREASETLRRKIRDSEDARRPRRARDERGRRDGRSDRAFAHGDRARHRRSFDDDRDDDDRRRPRGTTKRRRDERGYGDRGDRGKTRHNQPNERNSTAGRDDRRSGSDRPCGIHSSPGRPAKHSWADCSANPDNKKGTAAKGASAYYADDGRDNDGDSRSDDDRSATGSEGDSRRSDDDSSRDGDDNYAAAISPTPRKRAKRAKKRVAVAMSDDDSVGSDASAKPEGSAESFAVFLPPGNAGRKQNRARVAHNATRKTRVMDVDPLGDLADSD